MTHHANGDNKDYSLILCLFISPTIQIEMKDQDRLKIMSVKDRVDKFSSAPSSHTKPEPVTDKPKFRSRFLDRVRGKIESESPDKSPK